MKKFIIAAIAASLISTPVLAAPMHQQGQQDRSRVEQNDRRPQAQRVAHTPERMQRQSQGWKKGERFDTRQVSNYRVISNPRAYHLDDAPRGHRWVQSGNDAVLVGIASGLIAAVIAGSIN